MDQHRPLRLLAVESATATLSVALIGDPGEGEGLLGTRACAEAGHHAENLLPAIDALLGQAGCALADVTAFAVSIGPGSFTSLRVGLATVKGLAAGTGRPIVAVPTLEAMAFGALEEGDARPLVALLDARRGEMYAGIFEPSGKAEATPLRTRIADGLFRPEELAPKLPRDCRLIGEGALLFGEELARLVGPGVALPSEQQPIPGLASASSVARLALPRLLRGGVASDDLAPRYVRRADAEVTRTNIAVEDPV